MLWKQKDKQGQKKEQEQAKEEEAPEISAEEKKVIASLAKYNEIYNKINFSEDHAEQITIKLLFAIYCQNEMIMDLLQKKNEIIKSIK